LGLNRGRLHGPRQWQADVIRYNPVVDFAMAAMLRFTRTRLESWRPNMRDHFRGSMIAVATAAVTAVVTLSVIRTSGQATRPARTVDGKPNFNGIWQVVNEANWDLQAHEAHAGAMMQQGVFPYPYYQVPAAPVLALGAASCVHWS